MRLKDKVAIVTGAASGIGLATVELFVREGARVMAMDLAPDLRERLDGLGAAVVTVVGDAGREADIVALVAETAARFGTLDIAFANAGISGGLAGLFDQTPEDWSEILRINLIGPWLLIKQAAPVMKAGGGGSIVATASVAGLRSGAGGAAYSASKAGLVNLVQVAANQLTGAGIRVNAVCPGLIETGMTRDIFDRAATQGRSDRLGHFCPLRRPGAAAEIAAAVAFLASDEASYVNGQALIVDGGLASTYPVVRQEYGRTPL